MVQANGQVRVHVVLVGNHPCTFLCHGPWLTAWGIACSICVHANAEAAQGTHGRPTEYNYSIAVI